MSTLRGRVLTVAVLGLALTVGLLTAVTAWLSYERSLQVLDEDLQRQLVHILTESSERPPQQVIDEEPPATRVTTFLVSSNGEILAASRGTEDVSSAAKVADLSQARGVAPVNIAADDTTLRAVTLQVGANTWIVVAGEYDAVRAQAWQFAGLVAGVGAACLMVGAALTAVALSRAVHPVQELAHATAGIAPEDLRPVSVPPGPREVVELATELNTLLERVRDEDSRRNRFLATLSHEMRTPLTVARTQLEAMSLYGAADDDDVQRTAGTATAEIVRASSMLDAFLTLARSQEPGYVARAALLLPDVVADLRMRLSGMPDVTVHDAPAVTVVLDQQRIGQAILNCVANARRTATHVEVRLDPTAEGLSITVDDDGAGWPENRQRLLLPYASDNGSSGLGLAVVEAVSAAHGGRVELLDSPLGGAQVRIRIPMR